jgi:hypothetical protein
VMAGFKGIDGDIKYSWYASQCIVSSDGTHTEFCHSFDFNEHFGSDQKSFHEFYPSWEHSEMMEKWKSFLEDTLQEEEDNEADKVPTQTTVQKKSKALVPLRKTRSGQPLLPDDVLQAQNTRQGLNYQKDVIRSWVTSQYSTWFRFQFQRT